MAGPVKYSHFISNAIAQQQRDGTRNLKAGNQHFKGNGGIKGRTPNFNFNGSQLEKSILVGCKVKKKVHLINRDAQEKDTACKTIGNLC